MKTTLYSEDFSDPTRKSKVLHSTLLPTLKKNNFLSNSPSGHYTI